MCMQYIVNLLINSWQLTKTDRAIEYLRNLLEYDSSRDMYLKFQNGGSCAQQLSQGFSMKTPIMDIPFRLNTRVDRRVQ